ncbi:MAG: EscU/YscU/HrcU family type III secretion system export apparatus switch protein, partial [Cyanobacteria bacterium]|nr:EscU/YscU/HrcU family type III secretion system export apparatus switch protein [Cyanobacteriota bacterium]
ATALMLFGSFGPDTISKLYAVAQHEFSTLSTKPLTQSLFISLLTNVLEIIIFICLPFFMGTTIIGIISNLLQVQPLLTFEPLKPNFDKLNPINGAKRFFSLRAVMELVKALAKTIAVAWTGYSIVSNHMKDLLILNHSDVYSAWGVILGVISEMAVWTCILMIIMGGLDFIYQKYEYTKSLKMSKQEIKEERKEQDIDPTIKGRIRQMGREFTKRKQLAAVPKADVIITNPTHFAVAIQYDPDVSPAPRVIAKGEDDFAFQIREVAKANKVPIVENKPLARTLYAMVEVEAMIPPELFVAVAEVLAYVFKRNKGRNKHLRRPTK